LYPKRFVGIIEILIENKNPADGEFSELILAARDSSKSGVGASADFFSEE